MGNLAPTELILADATTSTGGLGKITTVAAGSTVYVRCPNDTWGRTDQVTWRVKCNKAHTVTLYRASAIVNAPSITFASLQDGDAVYVNGLLFTAETTPGDVSVSGRKFLAGVSDTADAAAAVVLLNHATYGVHGIVATSALGVITITAVTSYVTQCVTSVGGARLVCAQTLPAGLAKDTAYSGVADNSATAGTLYDHWVDGWAEAYCAITNNDSSNAATITVGATKN